MTVLYRQGGKWYDFEVDKLVNGLMTEASQHPTHPEFVVLYGHYTKDVTPAISGGVAYTALQIVGVDHDELPFTPGFV